MTVLNDAQLASLITRDPVSALAYLLDLAGATVKFGLRQQGHLPDVERMLTEGKSWEEIGRFIGWCPDAARSCYERESARLLVQLRAVITDLHSQHADDRCWMNTDELFRTIGLDVPDRRVGDKLVR